MPKNKERYIQFPLFMLRDLFKDKHGTLDKIIEYGIYNHALLLKKTTDEIHSTSGWILKAKGMLFVKDGSSKRTIKIAEDVINRTPPREVMPMVNLSLLFEFRDQEKTEFELEQLAAFIAIKSKVGMKPWCKMYHAEILMRMRGYCRVTDYPENIADNLSKYTNDYWQRKLITHLKLKWHVITYSKNRGFYVGIGNMDLRDNMGVYSEKVKAKTRIAKLKEKEKQSDERIKQLLYAAKNTTANTQPPLHQTHGHNTG